MKKLSILCLCIFAFSSYKYLQIFAQEVSSIEEDISSSLLEIETPEKEECFTCLHDAEEFIYTLANEEKSTLPLRDPIILPDPVRKNIDLPGRDKALTQKYIQLYLKDTNRLWLVQCLINSMEYRPYIREKLVENNMPLILQYLPIVESNYTTSAVSRSGATGMWQFMENSMSPFLKKNTWYDERKDPWKSTDAAINKLLDNYKTFGDWEIAIAAYNCGAGAMGRYLKAHPEKDFWYLAEKGILRQETALYIPKLLAIAEIVENAEYYGAIEISMADKLLDDTSSKNFDYVTIAGMLSLTQISDVTGIEKDTIKLLNPALTRGCTPAGEKYALRLPEGTGEDAEKALKENSVPTDALVHTVVKGDTLWGLSRTYKITVADLCTVNGIKENGILSLGQKIIVPIFN